MSFPQTVDELIDLLDRTFPEPAIGHEDTMDKIKFEAGQRSVVNFLKNKRRAARLEVEGLGPEIRRRGAGRRVPRKETKNTGRPNG